MNNDTTWQFLEPKCVIGRYLDPYIDVVSAMTPKILKNTGEVFPRSSLCTLTMEEMENIDLNEQLLMFDEAVIYKLDDPDTETEFPDKDLTPTYDAYVYDIT